MREKVMRMRQNGYHFKIKLIISHKDQLFTSEHTQN